MQLLQDHTHRRGQHQQVRPGHASMQLTLDSLHHLPRERCGTHLTINIHTRHVRTLAAQGQRQRSAHQAHARNGDARVMQCQG
ncbi:hypothetical protein EMGBS3_01780 [Anaerolineaceae bacterium]|nr:hypothetical protein EMGBS3_01780 [Anaerolineaceae bacterium]